MLNFSRVQALAWRAGTSIRYAMIIVLRRDTVCAKTRRLRAVAVTALDRLETGWYQLAIGTGPYAKVQGGRRLSTCFEAVPSRINFLKLESRKLPQPQPDHAFHRAPRQRLNSCCPVPLLILDQYRWTK